MSGETAPLLFTALNNQFWSADMNAPMANLPVVIFQFAMSPFKEWQQLAWAGALLITLAVLAPQHPGPLGVPPGVDQLNQGMTVNLEAVAARPRAQSPSPAAGTAEDVDAEPRLLLRQVSGAEEHQSRRRRARASPRSSGRRVAASRRCCGRCNRMYSLYPGPARDRRNPASTAATCSTPGIDLNTAARQGRHGVPEADAVPDVDLRQHRLRRPAVREPERAARWTSAWSGR